MNYRELRNAIAILRSSQAAAIMRMLKKRGANVDLEEVS